VQIQTEHVARVSDVGQLENGAPYIVMEYLEGTDLAEVLGSRGPLPIEDAIDYVLQALQAIAVAHRLRIVHRDLKPANLFLTANADGSPLIKVLDFGISKALDTGPLDNASLTSTVGPVGSPIYMSPEQIRTPKSVDTRTDIWSIGVILYELLTGAYPFVAEALPQLWAGILMESPARLRDARPDAPEALEEIIQRCLEKDVGQRFQEVSDLADALGPLARASSQICVDRIRRIRQGSMPPPKSNISPHASTSTASRPPEAPPPSSMASRPPVSRTPGSVRMETVALPPPAVWTDSSRQTEEATLTGPPAWGLSTLPPARRPLTAVALVGSAVVSLCVLGSAAFGARWLVKGSSSSDSATPAALSSSTTLMLAASVAVAPPGPAPSATEEAAPAPVAAEVPSAAASETPPTPSVTPSVPLKAPVLRATPSATTAPRAAPKSDGFSDRK
jgi:serine/threonine-protein kinase